MRYVTFYWSIMGGLQDVEFHADMPTALRYFKRHYRDYFQLNAPFRPNKLPASYGFFHRKFVGTSIRSFNKYWKAKGGAQ